jgi:hypothetical protein
MSGRDTLAQLAEEVGLALTPLEAALGSPETFSVFMAELGWDMRVIPTPISAIGGAITALASTLEAGEVDASTVQAAINGIRTVIDATRGIANQPASLPDTVDAAEFVAEFPGQLIDFLLVDYLLNHRPVLGQSLRVMGVIRIEELPSTARRPSYTRRAIAWADLARVFSDPAAVFRDAWRWGTADYRQVEFLNAVHDLAAMLALPTRLAPLDPAVRDTLSGGAPGPNEIHDWVLRIPVVGDSRSEQSIQLGIELFMLPASAGSGPGFALMPYAVGTGAAAIDLSDTLQLSIDAAFDVQGGVAMLVRPGEAPQLLVDLFAAAAVHTTPASQTRLVVRLSSKSDSRRVLMGSSDGSSLQIGGVTLGVGVRLAAGGTVDVFGELVFDHAQVAVKPAAGQADGFIANLLPSSGITADFDFGVGCSTSQGIYFTGSGGLDVHLPLHLALGPIEVTMARLTIRPEAAAIPIALGATFRGDLGPLKVLVENVGLSVVMQFPSGGGNVGPLDVALGFKPPNGAGLAIDAGVVSGGGSVSFDPEAGEYSGTLELEFANFLSLKAIGLITTRMPDGSRGFSLLLILTAEFPGGLQLGYGFKLIGVGGLIGLNRSMRLDAIMEGVRTGAIESVMFPHDVVTNAPRIISDLKAFFPPTNGIFLIGPMAKIGWGTPTLISVSLGVIIEIPGNIAILGVLKVSLPTVDAPLLLLQVNFAGAIEFSKRRLYFFASLYHSRVLTITIEGDLGLLVAWGDQPDFVLSVGGFHPAFPAPALPFPLPKRIALHILDTDVARIGVDGYFAVTSNTVQFGAHAELFLGFSALSVEGHLGFDALFQFSPFQFIVSLSAGVSVKVFGIGLFSVSLDITLSGPAPWEARGTASISLLFFSIPVDFDITWGQARDTTLPPVDVLPLLGAELGKAESWRTVAPAGGAPLVTLRALAENEADFVLHPLGAVVVQQRAVPLDIRVDKVGNERAADVSRCRLVVDGGGLVRVSDAVDMFALGQFQNLTDAQKLSLPPFEREHAGLELSPDGAALASHRAVRRSARYEEIVIDSVGRDANRFVSYNSALFQHFLGGASVTRSPLAQAERHLRQPFTDRITVAGDAYVVASVRDNTAVGPAFDSQAQARAHLDALLAEDPASVDALHVIPAMEVSA